MISHNRENIQFKIIIRFIYTYDITRPFEILGTIDAKVTLINVKVYGIGLYVNRTVNVSSFLL